MSTETSNTDRNEPEQIRIMQRMLTMSAERTYLNAERTLSNWIRTALALMIFGIAIDRFGLVLRELPRETALGYAHGDTLSTWGGAVLVALGVVMGVATGLRFLAYSRAYRRSYRLPPYYGSLLEPSFALLIAVFGIGLLVVLFTLP